MATPDSDLGKQVKVSVWTIPRSMSTILAKCLCGIEGILVYSEVFSWPAGARGFYTKTTGKEIPMELEGNEKAFEEAVSELEKTMEVKFSPQKLSYKHIREEVNNTKNEFIFMKEQLMDIYSFRSYIPDGFKHTFIIRHPSRVFTSYRRAVMAMFADKLPPVFDLVRDDFLDGKPTEWYDNLFKFWKYVLENLDPNPVIIDAQDLISKPGPTLRAYCKAVGFPYNDALLQWEATPDLPKNLVPGSRDLYLELVHFYGRALNSTHFVTSQETGAIPRDQLTDDVIRCVDQALPIYLEISKHKLQISE